MKQRSQIGLYLLLAVIYWPLPARGRRSVPGGEGFYPLPSRDRKSVFLDESYYHFPSVVDEDEPDFYSLLPKRSTRSRLLRDNHLGKYINHVCSSVFTFSVLICIMLYRRHHLEVDYSEIVTQVKCSPMCVFILNKSI